MVSISELLTKSFKEIGQDDFEALRNSNWVCEAIDEKVKRISPQQLDEFLKRFGKVLGINETEIMRQRKYFEKFFKEQANA